MSRRGARNQCWWERDGPDAFVQSVELVLSQILPLEDRDDGVMDAAEKQENNDSKGLTNMIYKGPVTSSPLIRIQNRQFHSFGLKKTQRKKKKA